MTIIFRSGCLALGLDLEDSQCLRHSTKPALAFPRPAGLEKAAVFPPRAAVAVAPIEDESNKPAMQIPPRRGDG